MRYKVVRLTVALVALGLLSLPAMATADEGVQGALDTETVFPLLGANLTVTVTTDSDGAVTAVGFDPPEGVETQGDDPDEFKFVVTDSGVEIRVAGDGDELEIKLEHVALADLVGTGSWSGDLFGIGLITITYEITGDGVLTVLAVVAPEGVSFDTAVENENGESKTAVGLFFGAQSRIVLFKLELDDDGDAELKVIISAAEWDYEDELADDLEGDDEFGDEDLDDEDEDEDEEDEEDEDED